MDRLDLRARPRVGRAGQPGAPSYRPFVDGEFVDGGGDPLKTVNPATEEVLAEVGTADASDVDNAVAAARRAYERTWGPMPGAERAKYLFRIARIVAERARELAVLETLDNGKPIRESRDVDVPDRGRAPVPPRRLGGQARPRRTRPGPAAAGRGRRGDPVELPAADGRLEDRPRAGLRQHDRAQTGRDHPADRAGAGRDRRRGRAAGRGAQRAARRRRRRVRRWSGHDGLDKVAFTGSTEVGKQIQARLAGTGRAAHPGAGRQGGQHRLRRRAAGPGGRGRDRRDLLQPGPRVLRRLPAAGPGVDRRGVRRAAAPAGSRRCGSATRWTRTPTSARSTPGPSWTGSSISPRPATPRARSAGPARARCPSAACSSRRPCSPASSRRCGSPARRSSARCCRC